jgi:hypothetical protein
MAKTLGYKALALAASMGLCVVMVSGCNPEEPAKPVTPAPAPKATTPAKSADVKPTPPATAPKAEEHK